ncbi:MAG: hypothetical protein L0177_03545 [Chloroflexi bacterium]|nr:hypothetical protein [Chloroflexota bacterium]
MQVFTDFEGREIRLTDERVAHIIREGHGQVFQITNTLEEVLTLPDLIAESTSNPNARLYYRYYTNTAYGDKYVVVVVIIDEGDAWIATAYISNRIKRGNWIWQRRS